MKQTLQQLLAQRRTELKIKPIKDSYVDSVHVDFVAVLNRHFNKRGAA